MLKLMNRFQRPVVPRQVKIGIDVRPIFPPRGERLNDPVENVFFVKQLMIRAQLQVARILRWIGNFKRPVAIRQLPHVDADIGRAAQMPDAVIRELSARPPPERIRVAHCNM